ncbi:actin cytoskeleton organization protein app1 [Gigaspora margarita]|uniref:Actin cytoskeleton organization protein app1 n=1 Tax=Gigaspora margarita TaxID=4874 RepID=A0A8H3ZZZ3_GIGMA|nr:actin cytoskeleton organization protein app1 [Gigaspora margarita]
MHLGSSFRQLNFRFLLSKRVKFIKTSTMSADKINATAEAAKEELNEAKEELNDVNEEREQHCLLFPTYATKHRLDESDFFKLTDEWNIRIRGLASRIAGVKQSDASYELLKDRTTLFWASNMDSKAEFVVKVIGLTETEKMAIEGDPKDDEKKPGKVMDNVNEKIKQQLDHPESEKSSTTLKPQTGNFNGTLSIKQAIVSKWINEDNNKDKSFIGGLLDMFGKDKNNDTGKIKLLKIEARRHLKDSPLAFPTYSIVNLLEPEGYSVISDIDDTIKQTNILEGARTVFSNTFLNDCKEVTGMPALYHKWYNNGVAIHYVSNSPWQLFPMLRTFFDTCNFPPGSAHLKFYDGVFKSAREQKLHPMESKFVYIRELLRDFPERKFILVGDTGEYDPEIPEGKEEHKIEEDVEETFF